MNKHFDDLDHLLKCTNKVFDIIVVNETRITKETTLNTCTNIRMKNYSFEFTSGALSIIKLVMDLISYDRNIYEANQLESTFVEIINPKNSNIAIKCFLTIVDILDFISLSYTIF